MKTIQYAISIIILSLIPFIAGSILILIFSGNLVTDFHLAFSETSEIDIYQFLDEKYHWHQMNTFQAQGFQGGYYTVAENEPGIDFFRYFSWGPFPPLFYGTIGSLTGFGYHTPIIINTVFFMSAIILLGYTIRLNYVQIGILILLFALFPTIILYYPAVMLEMLNIIVAIFLTVVFYRILQNEVVSSHWIVAGIMMLTIASLFRVTWGILFLPFYASIGWIRMRHKGLLAGVLVAGINIILMYVFYTNSIAPYPGLSEPASDPAVLFQSLQTLILKNLLYTLTGVAYRVLVRMAVFVVLFGVLYQGIMLSFKKQSIAFTWLEFWFHSINLGSMIVANLVLNDAYQGHDVRAIAPHLLLSLLLLVLFKRYRIIIPCLLIFVLMFPNLMRTHNHDVTAHFADYTFDVSAYQNRLMSSGIMYTRNDNGWCNTFLFDNSLNAQPELFFSIPAGLGLSRYSSIDDIDNLPRSKYILVSDTLVDEALATWNLERLMDVNGGSIFLNLDADCP